LSNARGARRRRHRSSRRIRSPQASSIRVRPEHAFLRDIVRAEYVGAADEEALTAFHDLVRTEGIIPAVEPAHELARTSELDKT